MVFLFINTDPIQTGLGQQQGSNPIADINPSDIESITILKDANATRHLWLDWRQRCCARYYRARAA